MWAVSVRAFLFFVNDPSRLLGGFASRMARTSAGFGCVRRESIPLVSCGYYFVLGG